MACTMTDLQCTGVSYTEQLLSQSYLAFHILLSARLDDCIPYVYAFNFCSSTHYPSNMLQDSWDEFLSHKHDQVNKWFLFVEIWFLTCRSCEQDSDGHLKKFLKGVQAIEEVHVKDTLSQLRYRLLYTMHQLLFLLSACIYLQ